VTAFSGARDHWPALGGTKNPEKAYIEAVDIWAAIGFFSKLRGIAAVSELPRPIRGMRPASFGSEGPRTRGTRGPTSDFRPVSESQLPSDNYFADMLRNGIRRIAGAARRRRYLFLIPALAMVPLSLAAALLLPRSFETSALLLLQESGRNNPFAGEAISPEFMQQKVPGLEALLKSEQVLVPSIRAMEAAGSKVDKDLQRAIRNLRTELSVELIGTDFLAIRLKGNKSQGLGRDLSIILSTFLEALLSEPRGDAAQIVLTKQQQQIISLEQKKSAIQRQLAGTPRPTENATKGGDDSTDLRRQLLQTDQQLIKAREAYESLTKRFPQTNIGIAPGILNAPGRIKIVDPPEDPSLSTTSRAKILLGGIAAGILLGIALAWAAELFDPMIYDRDELVSATGLSLLAVLRRPPQISGSAPPVAMKPRKKSRGQVVVSIAAAIVILGILGMLTFGVPPQLQLPNWLKFSNQETSLVQH
jgi:hypothetical protein